MSGWRLEARVTRPVIIRGGIVADQVGYGKTAITLGMPCSAFLLFIYYSFCFYIIFLYLTHVHL